MHDRKSHSCMREDGTASPVSLGVEGEEQEAVLTWTQRPRGRAPIGQNGELMLWNHSLGKWGMGEVDQEMPVQPPRPPSPPPPDPPKELKPEAEKSERPSPGPHLPLPVSIFWSGDKQWYEGVVDRVRVEKTGQKRRLHHVIYKDGDK